METDKCMLYELEYKIKKNKTKKVEAPVNFSSNRFKLANNEILSRSPLSRMNEMNNSASNIKKKLNTAGYYTPSQNKKPGENASCDSNPNHAIVTKLMNEKFSLIPNAVIDLPNANSSSNYYSNSTDNSGLIYGQGGGVSSKNSVIMKNEKNFSKKEMKKSILSKSITFNNEANEALSNTDSYKSIKNQLSTSTMGNSAQSYQNYQNPYGASGNGTYMSMMSTASSSNIKQTPERYASSDPTSSFYSRLLNNLKLDDKQILPEEIKQREKENTHIKITHHNKSKGDPSYNISVLNKKVLRDDHYSNYSFKAEEDTKKSKKKEVFHKPKRSLLVDSCFYKNVNSKIHEGYGSSFKLADDTLSSAAVLKTCEAKEDAFASALSPVSPIMTKVNNTSSNSKFLPDSNKRVIINLHSKKDEELDLNKFVKFDKAEAMKRKQKEGKMTLDSIFPSKKHSDNEHKKVDLLSKSAILDFKLNLKHKKSG